MIPSEVTTVMWFLSMDELLAITHCHLQPVAMKFLASLDPYSHKLCLFTHDICKSMASTCKFLKTCRVKVLCTYCCVSVHRSHFSKLRKSQLETRGKVGLVSFWKNFWDCYRGWAGQLLANFFLPVPSNTPRGLFLESPSNFSGPKWNIQVEI